MSLSLATFASLNTPPGRGGIAVILLNGPGAAAILQRVFVPRPSHTQGGAGRLQLGYVVDGGQRIDEAIVHQLGEAIEINIHGGPAAAQAAMEALGRQGAQRIAADNASAVGLPASHPAWANRAIGEELLAALPRAAGAKVVAALTQQWSGGISELACRCMRQLQAGQSRFRGTGLSLVSPAHTGEQQQGPDAPATHGRDTHAMEDRATDAQALATAAHRLAVARRLLSPPEVVLAGPPNAGKSTLANVLTGRAVSIVHDAPGTTRDWVRELANLEGLPVWLTDTAGLWDAPVGPQAAIDREAVLRALQCVRRADLVVLLGEVNDHDFGPANLLRVHAKCDVTRSGGGALAVSAHTGEGLDSLKREILLRLGLADFDPAVPMAFTDRQAELLTAAAAAITAGQRDAACEHLAELLG